MKVAIASDHAGFGLKQFLIEQYKATPLEWLDLGTDSEISVDYPDFGFALANAVADGKADFGVAICGTGIGISIAANRHPEIRAALCTDSTMASLSRVHNNANVLCLGARIVGQAVALSCLEAFLTSDFEGGRHGRRVALLGKTLEGVKT